MEWVSGPPRDRTIRQTGRRLVASTLLVIGLCSTAAAQQAAPEPPRLTPLAPLPPLSPLKDSGVLAKRDPAIEQTSGDPLARGALPSAPPFLPDRRDPFGPFELVKDPLSPDRPTTREGESGKPADDFRTRVLAELKEKQEVLERLSSEIRDHPDRADLYVQRGGLRLSSADGTDPDLLRAAIADFNRALGLAPDHLDARLGRGHALTLAKEYEAASADLSWVLQRQPDHYAARVERGQILAHKGEIDRAIADFDRAASAHPHEIEPDLLAWRGWCHSTRGDYTKAVADLSRAIEEFPVEISVWIERARCYLEMGDLERARFDIDEVLDLRPENLLARSLRFSLLLKIGAFGAAAAEAGRIRELVPNQPGPYILRAGAAWLAARQRDEVLAEVDRAAARGLQILPCAPVLRLTRAVTAGMTGVGQSGALADLDRCLTLEPGLSLPYALRAIRFAREGKFLPTCRDIALYLLTFDASQYSIRVWVADWKGPLFRFEATWRWRSRTDHPGQEIAASEPDAECLELGLQQLLASAIALR